jgi:hypothetical protein
MKKIVFAVQVFGLIAMFPIIVVLEMNHIPGSSPENNYPPGVLKKTEKTSTRLPERAKDKMANEVFSIRIETFLLKKSF